MTDAELLAVPTVTCDVALGPFVRDLDFDAEMLADVMRDRGVTEDDIASHTVHFSAAVLLDEKKRFGEYDPLSDTTTVYLGSRYQASSHLWGYTRDTLAKSIDDASIEITDEVLEGVVSKGMTRLSNKTLFHENEHAIERKTLSEEELIASRERHWYAAYRARENKKTALAAAASAAILAPTVELLQGAPPIFIEKSTAISILALMGFAVWLNLPESARRRYKNYRNSEWEIAARETADKFVPAGADVSELPLRVTFKIPDRSSA